MKQSLVKISNYSKNGKPGKFWTTPEMAASEYGDYRSDAYVEEDCLYHGKSSLEFLIDLGLFDQFDPTLKSEYGLATLHEMVESYANGVDKGKRKFRRNPNYFYTATQDRAEKILKEQGYPGVKWSYEDDLTPIQYHIWDKSIIRGMVVKKAR